MARDDWSRATLDASLGNSAVTSLCMPWEQGIYSEIFGVSQTRVVPHAERPSDARHTLQEASELPASVEASQPISAGSGVRADQVFLKHAVPLMAKKVRLSDEDIFELHVQRFELVLSHSYEASVLGRGFKDDSLEQRQCKVRLALGGKAPRTLQKRFGQAARLVAWADSESLKAFPIDCQIAEEYLRHLHEGGAKHSALTGAVECFTFLHHVLGVDMDDSACKTPIVQGILRRTRLERPEKRQALPLLVAEVLALEEALANASIPLVDRCCAGAFLFALYGRARLGDLRRLDRFVTDLLEESDNSCGYLEVLSLSHKCRSASNSRGMRMHIVVPAKGIGPRSWGKDFIAVSKECGRDLSMLRSGEPLLYLPDTLGNLSNIPAETESFARWAQDILSNLTGYSGEKITGHSAKSTPLSWMGKAGTDYDTQTLLGHHVLVGRNSALTYARDTQAAPVRKFESLLSDVRKGVFLPDSTRSGRFVEDAVPLFSPEGLGGAAGLFGGAKASGASPVGDSEAVDSFSFPPSPPRQVDDSVGPCLSPLPEAHEGVSERREQSDQWLDEKLWYASAAPRPCEPSDLGDTEDHAAPSSEDSSSSSDSSSDCSVEERLQASGDRADELKPRSVNECQMYRHRNTRTVHLLPAGTSSGRFVCGREFCESIFKPVCGDVHIEALECKQCYRGKPLRDIGALNHALEIAAKRQRM